MGVRLRHVPTEEVFPRLRIHTVATHTSQQTSDASVPTSTLHSAVLDDAHVGDIEGAWGIIRLGDLAPRRTFWTRLLTLLVIAGPGLITMVGDNDAAGIATYTQAGQNYGTNLL